MRVKFGVVGLCVAAIALTALGAPPVDAAQNQKKKAAATNRVATKAPPPRTRITVERRSFLDAGTQVQPGERKFTDYAVPPVHVPKRRSSRTGLAYSGHRCRDRSICQAGTIPGPGTGRRACAL